MAPTSKNSEPDDKKSPLRHLKPRLVPIRLHPFKQQFRNVADQASFLSSLKASIDAEGHVCEKCGGAMAFSAGDAQGKASLVCNACRHEVPLSVSPVEAMTKSDKFMAQSNQMFYVGCLLATLAALLSLWNGSMFTFFGGILLGSLLWVQSFGLRYRSWQYANMRVYERKSPFREWLRSEIPFLRNNTK